MRIIIDVVTKIATPVSKIDDVMQKSRLVYKKYTFFNKLIQVDAKN